MKQMDINATDNEIITYMFSFRCISNCVGHLMPETKYENESSKLFQKNFF